MFLKKAKVPFCRYLRKMVQKSWSWFLKRWLSSPPSLLSQLYSQSPLLLNEGSLIRSSRDKLRGGRLPASWLQRMVWRVRVSGILPSSRVWVMTHLGKLGTVLRELITAFKCQNQVSGEWKLQDTGFWSILSITRSPAQNCSGHTGRTQ